jgi:hypothetical protein
MMLFCELRLRVLQRQVHQPGMVGALYRKSSTTQLQRIHIVYGNAYRGKASCRLRKVLRVQFTLDALGKQLRVIVTTLND